MGWRSAAARGDGRVVWLCLGGGTRFQTTKFLFNVQTPPPPPPPTPPFLLLPSFSHLSFSMTSPPSPPTHNRSGFFIFCSDHRPKIKAQHPSLGIGDVAKKLGEQWNNLTDATKQPYLQKANKLKDKYQKVNNNNRDGHNNTMRLDYGD